MSTNIQNSFVKEFESEVHLAYQRMGSRLRSTVRTKSNVVGAQAVFQKIGKGTAGTKSRHGMIPVMDTNHEPIECTLRDYYTGSWLDAVDELKIEHDERQVLINTGAYALGRKTDELIIAELSKAKTRNKVQGSGQLADSQPLTREKILRAFEILGQLDIPDDGERYAVIGWRQWSELLTLSEFASSDYVGDEGLAWKGQQGKYWLGTHWIAHSGLPLSGGRRTSFWFHKTAIGHASGQDVVSDITWHGDRAAHFVSNRMSQGASLIEADGVVAMTSREE